LPTGWPIFPSASTPGAPIAECLRLGRLPALADLRLTAWAHMLGFRGHFSTKSRRYSTTLSAIAPSISATTPRPPACGLPPENDTTLVLAHWHFADQGPPPELAAYIGARRGELLYLRRQAVDLDAAEVTFGGSTAVVRSQRVEGTTKGGRSPTVSLDRDTVTVLREHRRQQAEERLAAGSAWNDNDGLAFASRGGEPLYPDTVTALMSKLINGYNKSAPPSGRFPAPGYTICATCTRPCNKGRGCVRPGRGCRY
jgi:hypothetical protein